MDTVLLAGGVVALRAHLEGGVSQMRAWACKGEGGSKKAEKLRAYLMYGPKRESGFMGLYSEQNYSHHVKEH